MIDDKRIVYCIKLWIKEIQETDKITLDEAQTNAVSWIVDTYNNGILNGTYCSDDEYNEYLLTGVV